MKTMIPLFFLFCLFSCKDAPRRSVQDLYAESLDSYRHEKYRQAGDLIDRALSISEETDTLYIRVVNHAISCAYEIDDLEKVLSYSAKLKTSELNYYSKVLLSLTYIRLADKMTREPSYSSRSQTKL